MSEQELEQVFNELTDRQREVARFVACGLSNRQVGGLLFVCEKTVKWHLSIVFRALGITSRYQLMVLMNKWQNMRENQNARSVS